MVANEIVLALKERYNDHPILLVERSIERANNETELFDILDSVPKNMPIVWCSETRRWVNTSLFKDISILKTDI